MRTGLIILGVIFLVVGGILYFYPSQTFSAQTTTGQSNPVNSSARLQIPVEWSFALSIIGVAFLIFGLVISSPMPAPAPVAQTHTIITGQRGPRGQRGSKGKKGSKGTAQQAKTVLVSSPVVRTSKTQTSPSRVSSVTTTTTRTR